ncbi:replication initiator protein [Microviridae sp.]|nr:replication initiator protein [Microviridae sp.]
MPCFHPIDAWRLSADLKDSDKRQIVFKKPNSAKGSYSKADLSEHLKLPCGQCIGCRLERSRQWAMRCLHESRLYSENCFITLTYDDKNLPKDWSLHHEDFQLFMKRLRRKIEPRKIRYYMCGEYGDRDAEIRHRPLDAFEQYKNVGRPHFHACIFNYDFFDKRDPQKTDSGSTVYESDFLNELWQNKGFANVGELNFDSAAYAARYCLKKITGDLSHWHYTRIDLTTGESNILKPEYNAMSRDGGIGLDYFKKYQTDMHKGFINMRGKQMSLPKFYLSKLSEIEPELYDSLSEKRMEYGHVNQLHSTPHRLYVRERIVERRLKKLTRGLES